MPSEDCRLCLVVMVFDRHGVLFVSHGILVNFFLAGIKDVVRAGLQQANDVTIRRLASA